MRATTQDTDRLLQDPPMRFDDRWKTLANAPWERIHSTEGSREAFISLAHDIRFGCSTWSNNECRCMVEPV